MTDFKAGQRWISEMEPELGIGIVQQADHRTVNIKFPASDAIRTYSVSAAPLKRVEFKSGDTIETRDGTRFTITAVTDQDGLLIYYGAEMELPESELSDTISFTTPQDRLLSGLTDRNRDYTLRQHALAYYHNSRQSEIRGFIGGRIDLLPHQLYVAQEASSRQIPRVLLSDETGLGKTIEVCLVLHRLLINERISRVLIIVPQSLIHQWFVELLRRFNMLFRIFDREYCESVTASDKTVNPFLENQLGICSMEFLTSQAKWKDAAISAKWDMLVIDEAHHLTEGSAGYQVAEKLSAVSRGLMLLTATPEQLGHRSHFARLRLLDPARYHDFEQFEREEKQYLKISSITNSLLETGKILKAEAEEIQRLIPASTAGNENNLAEILENNEKFRQQIINDLLDRHGTGRAVFRNTRAAIPGFPKRTCHLTPLKASEQDLQQQKAEFEDDIDAMAESPKYDYTDDARVVWLADFLNKTRNKKVLLICHSIEKVRAIDSALRKQTAADIALFHEELTLLQRDRNASWFAQEDGAQILLCSEIGSEGRNFQFSHHLVLFDLPLDPELLEQRIGRLDRIGQEHTIHIHVPYFEKSAYELLARWYHEGLGAFENNISGVYQIYQQIGAELRDRALECQFEKFDEFIERTRSEKNAISETLKQGRDRLLELNSYRPEPAKQLAKKIHAVDANRDIEKFMLDVFHLYGIREDRISERTYRLNLSLLSSPEFPLPVLKNEALTVTFDRKMALVHEDIEFLTWDHPMVIGVMDLILGSEKGNSTVARWPDSRVREILLEAVFILECVAPGYLNADRFLAPLPLRRVVNHMPEDCSEQYPESVFLKSLKNAQDTELLENPQVRQELFPDMLKKCRELVEKESPVYIEKAKNAMETSLGREVLRLQELKKVNKNIREEEIDLLKKEIDLLNEAISGARLRLDSLRLVIRGDI